MHYRLPALHYEYGAFEPYIDRRTMEIHHRKHHASYVERLNEALDQHPRLKDKAIEDLLLHLHDVPYEIRMQIRNNGGGHVNHSIFWQTLAPATGRDEPDGQIAEVIASSFGSFTAFKDQFTAAALSMFGSGWVWLIDRGDRLTWKRRRTRTARSWKDELPFAESISGSMRITSNIKATVRTTCGRGGTWSTGLRPEGGWHER
jgi:superoxide dismutase